MAAAMVGISRPRAGHPRPDPLRRGLVAVFLLGLYLLGQAGLAVHATADALDHSEMVCEVCAVATQGADTAGEPFRGPELHSPDPLPLPRLSLPEPRPRPSAARDPPAILR
mgnify:CR=1 FL=1